MLLHGIQTIISLCSAFINASHWNCECRCSQEAELQPRPHPRPQQASLLWTLVRSGRMWLLRRAFESSSLVMSARHSFRLKCVCELCSFIQAHSCRPLVRLSFSVACVYRHKNWKRQTVLFSLRVAVSSPCRVAALHLRVSCLRLSVLMHGPGLDVAFGILAAGPCAKDAPQATSRRVPG